MKKVIIAIFCVSLFASCSVLRKKEKYGCPGSPQKGQLTEDQRIANGEKVKQKKSRVKTGRVWKG